MVCSACLLTVFSHDRDHLSRVPSYKGIPPCCEGFTLKTNYLPKAPPLNTTAQIRASTYTFWETQIVHGNMVTTYCSTFCVPTCTTRSTFIMLTAQEDVGSRSVTNSILQMKTESEKLNCPKTQWLIKATLGFKHGRPTPSMPLPVSVHYHSPTELALIATPEAVPCFMVYKSLS